MFRRPMASHPADPKLAPHYRGFREGYLRWDDLTAQVQAWADAFPELVRLETIGESGEGRPLWLLTLGQGPDDGRPAVWVDGNLHAMELAGSSVALGIAEDVLRLHLAPEATLHGLPAHVLEGLRQVVFHVLPRVSPDGAEAVLETGRYVRSVPRDNRPDTRKPRWIPGDIDGDGLSLKMRLEDPSGPLVESQELPGVLVARTLDDPPPYYSVYPEGTIEGYDGHTLPDPGYLSDNFPDLNRNFPHAWRGEPDQRGAGLFPASEPESRAIVEFATAHPNLFAWLNLHTFGGVYIRPLGHGPDTKMDRNDLAVYRQIEAWAKEHTQYPMVSGYEEFTYEPDKPLYGDIIDFAFHERACVGMACELWNLFDELKIERTKRFVDRYGTVTAADMVRFARFDAEHNAGRIFRPWKKVMHPQLGEVEVGGLDPRIGMWNPPLERLAEVCAGQAAVWLRVAALAPRLALTEVRRTELGRGLCRLEVTCQNQGYLPTYVVGEAKDLPWNAPVTARLVLGDGLELASGGPTQSLGHLDGWGRGLHGPESELVAEPARGSTSRGTAGWTITGRGKATLEVGTCRTGFLRRELDIG